MKDFTWYQYLFTQFRALFVYMFNFLLPVNLNVDWDFPISHTILDHGAIVGLIGLLALAALAWHYRRRFPLAGYGFFVFLVLLAPTSSILPIQDPIAERRMYLPMLGLMLIAVDLLRRLKIERNSDWRACAAGICWWPRIATHARAEVWPTRVTPLAGHRAQIAGQDRAPHFQLAFAYFRTRAASTCAVAEFQKTARPRTRRRADLLIDWGLAYDGLNQPDMALAKFRAGRRHGTHARTSTPRSATSTPSSSRGPRRWKPSIPPRSSIPTSPPPTSTRDRSTWRPTSSPPPSPNSSTRCSSIPTLAAARGRRMVDRAAAPEQRPLIMRIGVNALYLIPGGVGGTEIYLRVAADRAGGNRPPQPIFRLHQSRNRRRLVPRSPISRTCRRRVRAVTARRAFSGSRPLLPLAAARLRLDVLFNPGFTAPLLCACPQVTVFHDLQHKRHPEYFRWFDLPFWKFFLFWSAHVSRVCWSPFPTPRADDLLPLLPPAASQGARHSLAASTRVSSNSPQRRAARALPAGRFHPASAQESGWPAARFRHLPRTRIPSSA